MPDSFPPAEVTRTAPASATFDDSHDSTAPQRILVKEVNWLGDLILSLPALRAIRASFRSARLSVMVKQELASFFDGMGWIDEIIPYRIRPGLHAASDKIRLIRQIRTRRFDLAVLFPNSFESGLWVAAAWVPRRAGFATDFRGWLLTDRARPDHDALSGHQSRYWLAMLRQTLGLEPAEELNLPLEVCARARERMGAWLAARRRCDSSLIALAPGAAYGPAKQWPLQNFVELVDLLGQHFNAECVLLGSPSERAACAYVAAEARHVPLNAAGETSVAEVMALLAECDGFAGNDSGAMHVAAALGRPAVGVFGSTNPARTGPMGARTRVIYHPLECSPCLRRTCRFAHYRCLRQINAQEVVAALLELGALKH